MLRYVAALQNVVTKCGGADEWREEEEERRRSTAEKLRDAAVLSV